MQYNIFSVQGNIIYVYICMHFILMYKQKFFVNVYYLKNESKSGFNNALNLLIPTL